MSETLDHIVTIGASAGGVESLREVVKGLPADFPAPVFVVLHIPAYQPSALPRILQNSGSLAACHPKDGEPIRPNRIYVAPPDHHMLVDTQTIGVKKGPKENRFRPSIDTLFRSAAYSFGSNVIGVVLSGALDDGTSGLWTIKRLGGTTVVQEPKNSRFESMPLSALEQVTIDHTLPAADIGPLVARLASIKRPEGTVGDEALRKRLKTEMRIAAEAGAFQKGIMEWGELTPFTCPECHGVLVKLIEDKITRYRCHTGHAYSDSSLLEGVMESTGEMLWQVMRSMEEAVMLLDHLGQHMKDEDAKNRAKVLGAKAREVEERSKEFRDAALAQEILSTENLVGSVPKDGE
ncbi:MAG TPA: chemotaxis protein CheB [Rhizomicrobium sp.]|jgi:two-component system chemotaxis response regulator CheB